MRHSSSARRVFVLLAPVHAPRMPDLAESREARGSLPSPRGRGNEGEGAKFLYDANLMQPSPLALSRRERGELEKIYFLLEDSRGLESTRWGW